MSQEAMIQKVKQVHIINLKKGCVTQRKHSERNNFK